MTKISKLGPVVQTRFLQISWPLLLTLLLTLLANQWLWPIPVQADGPTFTTSNDYGVFDSPKSVVLGDMDGDGDLDIVAGYVEAQNRIYLNDGHGNFPTSNTINENNTRLFGPATDNTQSIAVGDMNGDGHLDIVVGNTGASSFSSGEQNMVYLNDGFGNFPISLNDDTVRLFGPGTDRTEDVAVGDVNGDGHLDIITGNDVVVIADRGQVVYLNDGLANFPTSFSDSNVRLLGSDTDTTNDVAVGDVDSDGDLDIITVTGLYEQFLEIYLNNGEGDFVDNAQSTFGRTTSDIILGDLNGDNHLDIVVGREDDSISSVKPLGEIYLNDGTSTFSLGDDIQGPEINPDPVKAKILALGDMDGDGDLDLVMGKTGGGVGGVQSVLYLNDGKGNFSDSAIQNFGPRTGQIDNVVVGDVDGDADLDIITKSVIYFNGGTDSFSDNNARPIGTVNHVASVAVGDMNGDNHLDIITGLFNNGDSLIYLNNGNGNFSDDNTLELSGGYDNTYSVAVGDLDNDGDLDIVLGNIGVRGDSDNQNNILLNDGSGNFSKPINYNFHFDRNNTYSVILADMDGDEDLDIITSNGSGESQVELSKQNKIYLNEGIIDYTHYVEFKTTSIDFGTGDDDTDSLAVGDMDGDGDLDIVTGNWRQQNVVYLKEGDANFSESRHFGTGMDRTTGLAVGDVDGDGDLDIAAGNHREQNKIYLNDGAANFPISRNFGDGADGTQSVIMGDIDGDGDLDIVTGNGSGYYRYSLRGEPNGIYLNDGSGNFSNTAAKTFGLTEGNTLSAVLGDVDEDGNLDIITGNFGGGYFVALEGGRQSLVYQNRMRRSERLDNSPPNLTVTRPITTRNADFYSSPVLLDKSIIPFTYTLFDREGDSVGRIAAFYSTDGGDNWQPAIARTDTITTNLTTGHLAEYTNPSTNSEAIPNTGMPFNSNILITETDQIDELEVWLTITHTNNADLDIALQSPSGTIVPLLATGKASGQNFRGTRFSNRATTAIISGAAPYTGTYRPEADLSDFQGQTSNGTWTLVITDSPGGGSGALVAWGLSIKTPPATRVYYWDTFASGFSGQSDNVVIRLMAYPQAPTGLVADTYRYTNTVAGPQQWPYAAATTFPFRVRGAQVRVVDENGDPVRDAQVYRNGLRQPFLTNEKGFLPGRGKLVADDQLVALQPIKPTESYTTYYSSAPIDQELKPTLVMSPGVQTLTVSTNNPLILFNLDVSLEWDASNDQVYLGELERNLQRASEILYDLSNGGIALGEVRVYQAKERWQEANVIVYANNNVRPNADVGGFIEADEVVTETIYLDGQPREITNAYVSGQIRLGPIWSRFGSTDGNLGEDWARILAHELGHYLLFLLDNYLGIEDDLVLPVECRDSAMSDPYRDDYSEFLPQNDWAGRCLNTLAANITRRSDWETITERYPDLAPLEPGNSMDNPGPRALPLQVTQIKVITPGVPAELLPVPFFSLKTEAGDAVFPQSGQAQGYLIKTQDNNDPTDDTMIALGSPNQDLIHTRGAAQGDEVCVFDYGHSPARLGCETIADKSNSTVTLHEVKYWPPQITLTPVTSQTFIITVTASSTFSDSKFYAQILPNDQEPGGALTATLEQVETGREARGRPHPG